MRIPLLSWMFRRLIKCYFLRSESLEILERSHQSLLRLDHDVQDKFRRVNSRSDRIPPIPSFDGGSTLEIHVQDHTAPWRKMEFNPDATPGMISDEECRYYSWIARYYAGIGAAVELGPWLGKSTRYILQGLRANPIFKGRKLHVVDDFIWRASWMNDKVTAAEQLPDGQDFRFLFEKYSRALLPDVVIEQRRITSHGDNDHVPPLEEWSHGPVELLYVDCGRTFEVNEAWYRLFSKSFIPDRTVIMMQDWRLHREVPAQWFNQTKLFTDSKGAQLTLIHELESGCLATFLYRG